MVIVIVCVLPAHAGLKLVKTVTPEKLQTFEHKLNERELSMSDLPDCISQSFKDTIAKNASDLH